MAKMFSRFVYFRTWKERFATLGTLVACGLLIWPLLNLVRMGYYWPSLFLVLPSLILAGSSAGYWSGKILYAFIAVIMAGEPFNPFMWMDAEPAHVFPWFGIIFPVIAAFVAVLCFWSLSEHAKLRGLPPLRLRDRLNRILVGSLKEEAWLEQITCPNCGTRWELSREEALRSAYPCEECGTEIALLTSGGTNPGVATG